MTRRFILNEVSYFGPGARKELPGEVRRLGLHKALVCTDKDLIKFGVAQKVLDVLDEAQIPYEVFSEIKQNPTVKNVKLGLEAFAKSGADFLLAIGGGSSIDTSKAIGIITNNPEFADVVSLEGVADTKHKSVPIIALPTTAGTAAEVTINYVITDEENEKKMETAVNEPSNPEARDGMAVAQYVAGMAFSNVGLGAVHGMAHPLGAIFDIPHGVANALLLPIVMEFNAPAALDKYVTIAKAMNAYKEGMTREEAAEAAVDAVRQLSIRVGIPQHLAELGIKETDLPRLAKAAFADVCTPGNPRDITEEDILELYKKAF